MLTSNRRRVTGSAALTAALLLCLVGLGIARGQPADGGPRYWFLDSLTASDLTAEDWDLLRQNIQLALYELPDGDSVTWTDPATEHSGSIRVVSSRQDPERMCRTLRISVDVDAGSDDAEYEFCKTAKGFWIFR